MEVPLAVVPPRELLLVGVDDAVGVGELAGGDDRLEARALLGRHVRLAGERLRVVDVDVRGRDVEVAADDERRAGELARRARPASSRKWSFSSNVSLPTSRPLTT